MTVSAERCFVCDETVESASDRCLTCGADVGAPNVRAATTSAEINALQARYDDAIHRAKARGAGDTLSAFEKALASSSAVVNCSLYFLREFVSKSNELYANYHRTVQSGVRKAAGPDRDQERTVVDAILFRSYASSICCAALSLNGQGLLSYGPYALRLRNIAVANRSSVLEENSFDFVDRHKLGAKTPIPMGYRSDWASRGKLAVAKLADLIDVGPQKGGFSQLLLKSNGDRSEDQFMEVHIFGTFDFSAVECITGPVPKKAIDAAVWDSVKEIVVALGKRVEEY